MELSRKRSAPYGLLFLLSCFILIFVWIRWEEVVIQHPDGSLSIKADDRVDRLRNRTEFYKLVAASDGYFECPLCPPEATNNGKFFLEFRSVYKYGISMSPKDRYTQAELAKWNLRYIVIAVGSSTEMSVLETLHMAQYPVLPENLARLEHRRLVTPPGSGARLR